MEGWREKIKKDRQREKEIMKINRKKEREIELRETKELINFRKSVKRNTRKEKNRENENEEKETDKQIRD